MTTTAHRRVVGVGLLALFLLGLGVFLAPFAFPTPPPIVTRFQATRQFSPNGDGSREIARIAVRLNVASFVDVEIHEQGTDRRVKGLIAENRPKGIVRLDWDGTDDQGLPAADGRYTVRLRARSGKKQWNTSRVTVLDRTAPPLGTFAVVSAALAGPGEGECRVNVTALERGTMTLAALPTTGDLRPVALFGPRAVKAGEGVAWNWDGKRADGTLAPAGPYNIQVTLTDIARNTSTQTRPCWAGHLLGAADPARPKLGDRVGVRLRTLAGAPLAAATGVTLTIYRRPADGTPTLGARVGSTAAGSAGSVRIQLPRRIPPARIWILATTDAGQALIPLRP